MKIWIMSDLHVDAADYEMPPTPPDVDCIIIAGDVADGHERSARWLGEHAVPRGLPVIYVCGNHDHYGHDLTDQGAEIYRQAGVELLHSGRPRVVIAGVRIIGCTLWTDYAINDDIDLARAWARHSMPDMHSIDCGLRRVGTRDLMHAHWRQRVMLESELAAEFSGSTIVVTHHAPHPMSLRSPIFIDDSDASYVSDLSEMIEKHKPAIWIHGHVHQTYEYQVSKSRIVCNPRGYAVVNGAGVRVENRDFEPGKVIEI